MVIPPARTGRDRSRSTTVITAAHTNRGSRSNVTPGPRMLRVVEMKFTAPKIEDAPARCREKIAKSTLLPPWATIPDRGGYTVHPVPAPLSTSLETRRRVREGGRSQNLMLFNRGNAISGAPIIRGRRELPKPPIMKGITKKKIITKA